MTSKDANPVTHADELPYSNATSGMAATDVQSAIDEVHDVASGATVTRVWMPLTTVVGGVPELVWGVDGSLIPTEVPIT